jgi:branched-chain amino acid transport system substrate-binding protein
LYQRLLKFCAISLLMAAMQAARSDEAIVMLVTALDGRGNAGTLDYYAGAVQAARDIRAEGGLLGRTVRVEIVDNGTDPKKAAEVARHLVKAAPQLILGDTYSAELRASAPIYAAAGIVQITPSATLPSLTEQGIKSLFRVVGRDDQQSAIIADVIRDRWPNKHIAIVSDDSAYAIGLGESALVNLHSRGEREIIMHPVVPSATGYASLAETLRKERIDVTFIAVSGGFDGGGLVRSLRDNGYNGAIIGADTFSTSKFAETAAFQREGVIFTAPRDPRENPNNAAIIARFRGTAGDPRLSSFTAYAALQIWAQAVRAAGSFDGQKVAQKLHERQFDSVFGHVSFDSKGDIMGEGAGWAVYVWHGNSYERLHP